MKDALGIAAGFHEYFRNSDLFFMANYAQTVNVIGAIKTTKKDVEFAATGLVLKLYSDHFGNVPVSVAGVRDPLDVSAALTTEGNMWTLAVVNPDSLALDFKLEISGSDKAEIIESWEISNPDPMAYNEPGKPRNVDIKSGKIESSDFIKVEPYSVNLVKFILK
jgi:alpha-N-arabinofuranosidase